jgi:hypothetical protein
VAVDLPDRQDGTLPFPNSHDPLILAPDVSSWDSVARLAYAISNAVDRPEFAGPLKLAARELERRHAALDTPTEQQLADAPTSPSTNPKRPANAPADQAKELTNPAPQDARDFRSRLERYRYLLPLASEDLVAAG